MEARDLVDLAALAATHGPVLMRQSRPLSVTALNRYWTAAHQRMHRWRESIDQFELSADRFGADWSRAHWHHLLPVLEEIISGEILCRVWTAVVAGHDRRHGKGSEESRVAGIFADHQQATARAAATSRFQPPGDGTRRLPELAQRCRRWTDVLVGHLDSEEAMDRFAPNPQRARDFVPDASHPLGDQAWDLTLGSLRASFAHVGVGPSGNNDLNECIAAAVLSCFPLERNELADVARSLWMVRLQQTADHLIDLLGQEGSFSLDKEAT